MVKLNNPGDKLEHYITKGLFNELILKIKKTQHTNSKNNINSFDLEHALEAIGHNKWSVVLDTLSQC